ncbi:hypothetical protein [Pseudohongiella spirulinae]|uniref:Fimbrial assembly family protein n=1 Tax=Pseudohongiella spirulinae TaxID=1249552 RepID=A0A0S2KGK5_9GAMM|nr:hypothetical protein [Pseudohongiella spirulinae]ALO47317.1 hypothetical protein PS2015_2685 [Pseudohongiella spirulinae]
MDLSDLMLINFLPWREKWHRQRLIRLVLVNVLMCSLVGVLLGVSVMMLRSGVLAASAELQCLQDEESRLQLLLGEFSDSHMLWRAWRVQAEQLIKGQMMLGTLAGLLNMSAESAQVPGQLIVIENLKFSQSGLLIDGRGGLASDIDVFARQLRSALADSDWHIESLQQHYQAQRGYTFGLRAAPVSDDV